MAALPSLADEKASKSLIASGVEEAPDSEETTGALCEEYGRSQTAALVSLSQ